MSIKNKTVRVRFAPSPTGEMHIGNLRAAIFNYLFATKMNGEFFLRIEDTDKERSLPIYTQQIINTLDWVGLTTYKKHPIIYQSKNINEYKNIAQKLYREGYAYYCSCDNHRDTLRCPHRNSKKTAGVLRFKTPDHTTILYKDLVYGEISVKSDNVEDFALLRSNGDPTYMLCVVVDDSNSNITHVIRGEDHRTNTFKQILIYNTLKKDIPIFAHLPMILGQDGKKLSKRNGNASVEIYRKRGIPSMGLLNALARIGWGESNSNRELYTKGELVNLFNFKGVKCSAGKLNEDKIKYFSKHHFRNTAVLEEFVEYMKRYKLPMIVISNIFFKNSVKKLSNFAELYEYLKPLLKGEHTMNKSSIKKEDYNLLSNAFNNHDRVDQTIKNIYENKLGGIFRTFLLGDYRGPSTEDLIEYYGYEHLKQML